MKRLNTHNGLGNKRKDVTTIKAHPSPRDRENAKAGSRGSGSGKVYEVDEDFAREINDLIDLKEVRQGLRDVYVSE